MTKSISTDSKDQLILFSANLRIQFGNSQLLYRCDSSCGRLILKGLLLVWQSLHDSYALLYHPEAKVPGSGSDDFLVDNGRGQLRLKLEPGDYIVTVQDLDAGVNEYYYESEDFAVKGIFALYT